MSYYIIQIQQVAKDTEVLFKEVLNKLHQIAESSLNTGLNKGKVKVVEPIRIIAELEGVLQKEKTEFEVKCHSFSSFLRI